MSLNRAHSSELISKFNFLVNTNVMLGAIHDTNGKQRPLFKTINDDIMGYDVPIIFDNSVII